MHRHQYRLTDSVFLYVEKTSFYKAGYLFQYLHSSSDNA